MADMKSGNTSTAQVAACVCRGCTGEMKFLGQLAPTVRGPAIRVFRCYDCNVITTETFDQGRGSWVRSELS